MESTLVIKVKFGNTLRRFNARVDSNEKLDPNMAGLRAKIRSLFNLAADADLTLTYVDEDGDVVTLVGEDDLHDVVRQRQKFLRIDVELSNDKDGNSYARSSGSYTPLRGYSRVQHPFPPINTGVTRVLNSVEQPLLQIHVALSKLSFDIVNAVLSKALSVPVLAELLDSISRVGQSYLNPDSLSHVGADSSTQNVASGSNASKDGDMAEVVPKSISVGSAYKNCHRQDTGLVTIGVGAPVTPIPTSVDLNIPPIDSNRSGCVTVNVAPVALDVPARDDRNNTKEDGNGLKSPGCDVSASSSVTTWPSNTTNMPRNPFNEFPFTGMPKGNVSAVPSFGYLPNQPLRGYSCTQSMGFQCDACGVHPITGPLYKSKAKENYGLCSICFSEMGNETDYHRVDHPASYSHRVSFKGLCNQMNADPWVATPVLPSDMLPHNLYRGRGSKLGRQKLDSRFIFDVNVMDDTMMAPSTSFTKIWRMSNNGSMVWPRGTQLVWIGGDRFSNAFSVEIKIPENGVPVGRVLDISVDFTAPASPGRYNSIWKMAAPSGQMFGQRVWVIIQVSLSDSLEGLNLNLTHGSVYKGPETIGVNVQPAISGELLQPSNSSTATEPVKPVDELLRKNHDLTFPIKATLLVGHGISSPATPEAVSYPMTPLSETSLAAPTRAPSNATVAPSHAQSLAPAARTQVPSKVVDAPASAQAVTAKNAVEETLLKELEEMGFKQVDLNKEILKMNDYNLEQSVEDLCGVAEWDPILEDLREMGFRDNETNKRLLMKNNGSIKRVVMDLISREKDQFKALL